MSNIVVTSSIVFNLDHFVYMYNGKLYLNTNERTTATSKTKGYRPVERSGLVTVEARPMAIREIIEQIKKIKNYDKLKDDFKTLENNFKTLENNFNALKTHVMTMPGGMEYFLAKDDFEKKMQMNNKNY